MFPHWSDPPSCGHGCGHTSPFTTTTTTAYLHPTVVLCVELKEVIGLQNRVHELCEAHPLFTLTTLLHTGRCAMIGDGCVVWEEAGPHKMIAVRCGSGHTGVKAKARGRGHSTIEAGGRGHSTMEAGGKGAQYYGG